MLRVHNFLKNHCPLDVARKTWERGVIKLNGFILININFFAKTITLSDINSVPKHLLVQRRENLMYLK